MVDFLLTFFYYSPYQKRFNLLVLITFLKKYNFNSVEFSYHTLNYIIKLISQVPATKLISLY